MKSDPVCSRGIYKIVAKFPYYKSFPDPLGVIVYAAPICDLVARHRATNDFFKAPDTLSNRVILVNTHITYISRIIIDPRFHRQGLASLLLEKTIPLQDYTIIETLTPLDHTSGLFRKFGFREFHQPTPPEYIRIQQAMKRVGISFDTWHVPEVVQSRIDSLSKYRHAFIHFEMKKFLQKFKSHRHDYPGITRTRYLLSKIIYPNAYQIFFNPKKPLI